MKASPTSRSLAYCREQGWPVEVVERWIPQARRRKDLFGFIDLVAITPDGILGIQATSGSNVSARVEKAKDQPHYGAWLAFARAEVWGWAKQGPRGKRKVWTLRRVALT